MGLRELVPYLYSIDVDNVDGSYCNFMPETKMEMLLDMHLFVLIIKMR